jgi:hypothetical protein
VDGQLHDLIDVPSVHKTSFPGVYNENNEYDTTSELYNLLVHPGWSVHWLKF